MLMLIWIYRVVLAKFLYFVSSAVMLVIALFALKRGIYKHRPKLRQGAFIAMFIAFFKTLMVDFRLEKEYLLCDLADERNIHVPYLTCDMHGMMMADFTGMVAFVIVSFLLFSAYRTYMPEKKRDNVSPDQVHLKFWANLSMWGVIAMICWLAAPWFGFLTVGYVPVIFIKIPVKDFAIGNLFLLLWGFWVSESCSWTYELAKKDKMKHLAATWTPRDTLWMTVFLYVIALALSYVSQDVLTVR